MNEANRYRIETVIQAGQVLKVIADSKTPLGPLEVAKLIGITSNTSFRLCVTLDECGFLKQIGDKYELGMGMALFWARKKAMLESERERVNKDLEAIDETMDS